MKYWWLAPVMVIAGLAQSKSDWSRQGPYWVRTETGTLAPPASGKVRIHAPGPIQVAGEMRADIAYKWICGVRTVSEVAAQEALRPAWRTVVVKGEWQAQFRGCAEGKLWLAVPKKLLHTTLESYSGKIDANDLDGSLEVESGGGPIQLGRISGTIKCRSGGGSIVVDRVGGESWFETAGGDVVIRIAGGPVHASTAGGNIQVRRAASFVAAQTAGGVIEVWEAATGGVECNAGTGTILLHQVAGALRAVTGRGSILADLSGIDFADSVLRSQAGDITVVIPARLGVTVVVEAPGAAMARIISDFPEVQPRMRPDGQSLFAQGELNGGGPVLRLMATGGTVYLRRRP